MVDKASIFRVPRLTIVDILENLTKYLNDDLSEPISEFLSKVGPNMEEGRYPILGDRAYAKVMSYDTMCREMCKIEAHDLYIDIQSTVVGAEGIDVFDRNMLSANTKNENEDVSFFDGNDVKPFASVTNATGHFTLLLPTDAHRPTEQCAGFSNHVKKFVIKIKVGELR